FIALLCLTISCLQQNEQRIINEPETKRKDPHSPEDWMYRQRAYPHGHIRKDIYLEAIRQWQQLSNARSGQDLTWQPVGPYNTGGRITSLAVSPADDQTLYVGAASGGVFKTTDGGNNWTPVFDQAASLSIGDLAVAPSSPQTIYVGTGEANAGGGSLAYDGAGIYKSTDGGASWSAMGLEKTGSTGKITIHPQQSNIVYAATMGSLFENNEDRGLYRSIDGGANWENILNVSDSTGVIDIAIHPTQPDLLFAATWERIRRPNRRQYGGITSGIYRSDDGGDNWTKLSLPLSNPYRTGRIGLTISPVDPQRIYASVVNDTNSLLAGIYQSDDLGETWNALPLDGIVQAGFMWWFGKIYADPLDAERIYICSLDLYQYEAGNTSWEKIMTGVHVDQHALYIEPQNRDYILLGNDGGLYRSDDPQLQEWSHFENLPITQFYTAEVDYLQPDRLFGGTQDNGCLRKDPATGIWHQILGGDGFVNLVDPSDSRYVYASAQYGSLRRSTNGGNSFSNGTPNMSASEMKNWHTPVVLDPIDPATIYYGGQRVHRSTTRAISWSVISPLLVEMPENSNLSYGTLSALAVSPADTRIIYAGADDGTVFITEDGGNSWTNIDQDLPKRWVTRLTAHPTDPEIAYITFSGYRWNEYLPHVFRTEDRGTHWIDISAGLPEVPVNDLVINPDRPEQLFLATDAGVFISENEGEEWEILGQELPKVVVTDLSFHAPTSTLAAATYGRSMYQLQLESLLHNSEAPLVTLGLKAYPNPFRDRTQIALDLKDQLELKISIYDLSGKLVQALFEGVLPAGAHQFTFNTRQPASTYVCRIQTANGDKSLLIHTL
ncbi:MAG: T9SS type A sorting domain-containing protein, partial [Lewinella sp.]|nr:T9SS type A sorting domain-containing protein [Lewinella sp.]